MTQREPSLCPEAAEALRSVDSLRERVGRLEDEVRQMARRHDAEIDRLQVKVASLLPPK